MLSHNNHNIAHMLRQVKPFYQRLSESQFEPCLLVHLLNRQVASAVKPYEHPPLVSSHADKH